MVMIILLLHLKIIHNYLLKCIIIRALFDNLIIIYTYIQTYYNKKMKKKNLNKQYD